MQFYSGTHVLYDDWNVTGPGNLSISGGTLDVASSGSIESSLTVSGLLTGADVTVGGLFTWTGGALRGTGTLFPNGGMLLAGSNMYLERTVDNVGTATWTGGAIIVSEDGVFNNAGTLLKSGGGSSNFSAGLL